MSDSQWNGLAVQDRLLRRIDDHERYRGEHLARIARKQSNGSQATVDEMHGAVKACEALLGQEYTKTRAAMAARIDELLEQGPPKSEVTQEHAFRRGWDGELRLLRPPES